MVRASADPPPPHPAKKAAVPLAGGWSAPAKEGGHTERPPTRWAGRLSPIVKQPAGEVKLKRLRDRVDTLSGIEKGGMEWAEATRHRMRVALLRTKESTQVRNQTLHSHMSTVKQLERTSKLVEDELVKRVHNVQQLQKKLEKAMRMLEKEIGRIEDTKKVVSSALVACSAPLQLAEKRALMRLQGRPQREMVVDGAVERALANEAADLRKTAMVMQQKHRELEGLQAMLQRHVTKLQADITERDTAISIDMASLCVDGSVSPSRRPKHRPRSSGGDKDTSKNDTLQRIAKAAEAEAQAATVRKEVEAVIKRQQQSNHTHFVATNTALQERIRKTAALHRQLEAYHQQVLSELSTIEADKRKLLQAIDERQQPMNVVKERLALCHEQPVRDGGKDPVEASLEIEASRLDVSLRGLHASLAVLEREKEGLRRSKLEIEADIRDKAVALDLDRKALEYQALSSAASSVRSLPRRPSTAPSTTSRQTERERDRVSTA